MSGAGAIKFNNKIFVGGFAIVNNFAPAIGSNASRVTVIGTAFIDTVVAVACICLGFITGQIKGLPDLATVQIHSRIAVGVNLICANIEWSDEGIILPKFNF